MTPSGGKVRRLRFRNFQSIILLMVLPKVKTSVSVGDYLDSEVTSLVKHEYISGEVYAMAGASDRHHRISANLFKMLDDHLPDGDCEAFWTELKLRADEETFYYPDVFVACDENPESAFYRDRPVLIIEVVSPSTRTIDRREKLLAYKRIPSLREYAVVEQDKMHIEMHRRQDDGSWITQFYTEGDREIDVEFRSVSLLTSLDAIYRRVRFPAPAQPLAE